MRDLASALQYFVNCKIAAVFHGCEWNHRSLHRSRRDQSRRQTCELPLQSAAAFLVPVEELSCSVTKAHPLYSKL